MEATKEYEKAKAVLRCIIFHNRETGYLIGSFGDRMSFTALGNILNPQIGLTYALSGEWVDNPQYGRQFKIHHFETVLPSDPTGIHKYLVRVCKFVGNAVGNNLVDTFGDKTLEVLKANPNLVASKIKGLTIDRALSIQNALLRNEANEKVMIELEAMLNVTGMRRALPVELIKMYGSNAAEEIRRNPYVLTEFAGIGFPLADRVALHIGFDRDGIQRKEACALHCVKQAGQLRGDIWVDGKLLLNEMLELIQVNNLSEGIRELVKNEVLVEEDGLLAMANRAGDEEYIAEKVVEMVGT